MRSPFSAILCCLLFLGNGAQAAVSYANVFVDPNYIVARQFPNNTLAAQQTIIDWAQELVSKGPWSACSFTVFSVVEI
jgi:predicted 3-demethylubiquinone-9 3-methyltransferase (glyoxalase superfamily)